MQRSPLVLGVQGLPELFEMPPQNDPTRALEQGRPSCLPGGSKKYIPYGASYKVPFGSTSRIFFLDPP